MSIERKIRVLEIYAAFSGCAIVLLGAAALRPSYKVINAQRLNIIGADGKPRLALANKERLPAALVNGQAIGGNRGYAGMLFYNEEGDENGGLIFGGEKKNGFPAAGASLTFDQYKQDQTLQLLYEEEGGKRSTSLSFNDVPEMPLNENMARFEALKKLSGPEKTAAYEKMKAEGLVGAKRLFIGKDRDKNSKIVLSDAQGKPRIKIQVAADGNPELLFLDAGGKVTKKIGG